MGGLLLDKASIRIVTNKNSCEPGTSPGPLHSSLVTFVNSLVAERPLGKRLVLVLLILVTSKLACSSESD